MQLLLFMQLLRSKLVCRPKDEYWVLVSGSILGDPARSKNIFNEDFLSLMVHHKIPSSRPFPSLK